MSANKSEEKYWTTRYAEKNTGWDVGYPSTPIKAYIDQLENKALKILIPGAGNAYEAEHLHNCGFENTYVLDISIAPLSNLKKRCPDFPSKQLMQENFFTHKGQYDLIIEQTFFCSFEPSIENRSAYAQQMQSLLKPGGKLVGLWFDIELKEKGNRPYGGSRAKYLSYLQPYFKVQQFESCYNSIQPRAGNELFGIFVKKTN